MLALTVIKNTVTKRLWNFQIHFLPFSNAFEKIFFPNMFFYHFLQLCPRGHISKMLAVTVIKNTVTKRLWNFQIHFLPFFVCNDIFLKKLPIHYLRSGKFGTSFFMKIFNQKRLGKFCCVVIVRHTYQSTKQVMISSFSK